MQNDAIIIKLCRCFKVDVSNWSIRLFLNKLNKSSHVGLTGPPEGKRVGMSEVQDLHHEVGLDMGIIFMYNISDTDETPGLVPVSVNFRVSVSVSVPVSV